MEAVDKITQYITKKKLDGFVVTKKENVFWATGFWGSFAILLVKNSGEAFLTTDSRYFNKAKILAQQNNFKLLLYDKNFFDKYGDEFQGIWAVERSMSLSEFSLLKTKFKGLRFKSVLQVLENLKREKDLAEIQKIEIAQQQTDLALNQFSKLVKVGVTEKELAFKLECLLKSEGKFSLAFESIVAFGANSAIPHHEPSNKKLELNQNILVDCGASFNRYCSDTTRNFWFGEINDKKFKEYSIKFEALLEAQSKTLARYKNNAKIDEIDKFCRAELRDEAEFFSHSLGHGVGTEIHEQPTIRSNSKQKLHINDVVTCEPGVYYEGKFGIRIEDLVVITDYQPKILSRVDKDLVVCNTSFM